MLQQFAWGCAESTEFTWGLGSPRPGQGEEGVAYALLQGLELSTLNQSCSANELRTTAS